MSKVRNYGKLALPILAIASGVFVSACINNYGSDQKEGPLWVVSGFKSPESAVISEEHGSIFVSNVNGYEENGAGFISRLSMDGVIKELAWFKELNAPTGLAIRDDMLWVVDYNRLVGIHIPSRLIVSTFPSDDDNPLLNDVATADDGSVFVTGSASNSIYRVENGRLVTWLKDDDALQYANGIDVTPEHIIIAANTLMRISRDDKRIENITDDEALYDLEGVKADGRGGYYVSAIGDRPLYHVDAGGSVSTLFTGRDFIADFDFTTTLLAAPISADAVAGFQFGQNP